MNNLQSLDYAEEGVDTASIVVEVNYPQLKLGASNFNGTSKDRGLASLGLTDSASISSSDRTGRYHTLCFIANVDGGIYVSIVPSATFIANPHSYF